MNEHWWWFALAALALIALSAWRPLAGRAMLSRAAAFTGCASLMYAGWLFSALYVR